MTEAGCAWVPPLLDRLDKVLARIRDTGATGEIRYGAEHVLPRSATDYFRQNVWMGVSQPGPADAEARHRIGLDKFMWGSDYPHDEGTAPVHPRAPAGAVPRHRPGRAAPAAGGQRGRRCTASTSTPWPRWPRSSGRRSTRSPQPLTELPPEPNEALLNSVGDWL